MSGTSEEFIKGVLFVEDSIHSSIYGFGLQKTLDKILSGYSDILTQARIDGINTVSEKVFGGMYALHLFLERHKVPHEWRFRD